MKRSKFLLNKEFNSKFYCENGIIIMMFGHLEKGGNRTESHSFLTETSTIWRFLQSLNAYSDILETFDGIKILLIFVSENAYDSITFKLEFCEKLIFSGFGNWKMHIHIFWKRLME